LNGDFDQKLPENGRSPPGPKAASNQSQIPHSLPAGVGGCSTGESIIREISADRSTSIGSLTISIPQKYDAADVRCSCDLFFMARPALERQS
jgi:hypothetical protein